MKKWHPLLLVQKKTKLEVLIEFIKNKLNIERRQKGNFFKSWFIN